MCMLALQVQRAAEIRCALLWASITDELAALKVVQYRLEERTIVQRIFFFKQKTAYEIGLGIPAEPLFRSRLVVLLPFQLLRLSLATPSRWTPLALSVFLHCVVALLLTLL